MVKLFSMKLSYSQDIEYDSDLDFKEEELIPPNVTSRKAIAVTRTTNVCIFGTTFVTSLGHTEIR